MENLNKLYLEFSYPASDGSNNKSDLEFNDGTFIRNAEIHLNIDFDKQNDDQTEEFRLVSEYWDDPKNVERAIEEADNEDIELGDE